MQLHLLNTEDPDYAALGANATAHAMINRASIDHRLSVQVEADSCVGSANVTEGTPASRGYGVQGAHRCNVTVTLCLESGSGGCVEMTKSDVYNISNGTFAMWF